MIDLYNERDHTRWFWRMAANISTLLIMTGYVFVMTCQAGKVFARETKKKNANNVVRCSFLVYPSAFSEDPALKVDQSVTSIVAIILLALGFTVSVTLWFICTSWLFQLDVIFLYVFSLSRFCQRRKEHSRLI